MSEGEASTEEWYQLSLAMHRFYNGKIEMIPKVPVRGLRDLAVWYSPGVAAASRAVYANPEASFELTSRWNTIAVVSDGTRV
ncbi:MAG: malate dehydrogenase, partial [Acidilobus sp.]